MASSHWISSCLCVVSFASGHGFTGFSEMVDGAWACWRGRESYCDTGRQGRRQSSRRLESEKRNRNFVRAGKCWRSVNIPNSTGGVLTVTRSFSLPGTATRSSNRELQKNMLMHWYQCHATVYRVSIPASFWDMYLNIVNPAPIWSSEPTSVKYFRRLTFPSYLAPIVYQNTMGLSRNLSLILGGFTSVTYMFASFIPLWVGQSSLCTRNSTWRSRICRLLTDSADVPY